MSAGGKHSKPLRRDTPTAIEAEKAVLGTALRFSESVPTIVTLLPTEAAFYLSAHQTIYSAIIDVYTETGGVDPIAVSHNLQMSGELSGVGGRVYLNDLMQTVLSDVRTEAHCAMVVDAYQRRELIDKATRIAELAYDYNNNADALIATAHADIDTVADTIHRVERPGLADATASNLSDIELYQTGMMSERITRTGLTDLDRLLEIRNDTLTVIAGRPSLGKTALAMCIMGNVSATLGRRVLFFSHEMSAEEITFRMLTQLSRVTKSRIMVKGALTESDLRLLEVAAQQISELPIDVRDSGFGSWPKTQSEIRRCHRRNRPNLIIVDYLQLMDGGGKPENRNLELGHITRGMKALAKEIDTPIILLSQFSREVEKSSRKPRMSDLRDSGSIEQDADNIIFIHRDDKQASVTTLIVDKQRNGPTGEVDVFWDKDLARFANLSYKDITQK